MHSAEIPQQPVRGESDGSGSRSFFTHVRLGGLQAVEGAGQALGRATDI